MKTLAIAVGAIAFGAAATASADYYVYRSYPAYPPATVLSENQECWNPHAGHFEGVRPGDYQPDLDFSRCRMKGEGYYYGDRYANRYYADRGFRREECWNPRAGHFERVRPGEYQGDLDFTRCRVY